MYRSKVLYFFLLLILLILLVILSFFSFNYSKGGYESKTKAINKVIIDYPVFHNKIDQTIKNYLSNLNLAHYSKVKYAANNFDKYTSVIFFLYKNDKMIDCKSLLFNKANKKVNADSIILNKDFLINKLDLYIENNNLKITKDEVAQASYNYLLTNDSLSVYLSNYDNVKTVSVININYNELENNINLNYQKDKNYQKMSSTTTTAPIYSKVVAFTFDDGPSKYTEEILAILDEYKAKATFFEVGYMINSHNSVTIDAYNRGFEIGNHTYDHSNLTKFNADTMLEKINSNNNLYHSITNDNMVLVRPPYGYVNSLVKSTIAAPLITWSVDSRDWESRNTDKIVTLVESTIQNGDIILFHDLYPTTVEAIKILVPYLSENDYKIVSVSELFKYNNKTLENGHVYRNAR